MLVASSPNKTTTVTLRLTGPWYQLWEQLKQAVPNVGDAEIVRRGVALYMALEGLDSKGRKPHATIDHRDASSAVANHAQFLQFANGIGNAFTAHTEHGRNQFLRGHQFCTRQAVQRQQQPAAQLLIDRVIAVA